MLSQKQYNDALKNAIEECNIGDAKTLNLTIEKVSKYNYDFIIQSNGVDVLTGGHDPYLGWFHAFEFLDKKLENNKTFLITYMKLCDNLDKKYKRGK